MPRTIEHIVETHQIARDRRAAGKPVWQYELKAERRDGDFEWNRDTFAAALKGSKWFRDTVPATAEHQSDLWQLWDEIKDSEDVAHFDAVLDAIYDLADYERCAITFVRV